MTRRTPWYSQEKRPAPLFVYCYMGRKKTEGVSPFRFILNHSKAVATNSYHVLYPKKHLEKVLQTSPDMLGELWQALKGLALESLLVGGRTYGGGLYKIEPSELANVVVENLPDMLLEALGMVQPRQSLWRSSWI